MAFDIEWIFITLALGTFVGILAGLMGVGGGGVMVPVLTSIFLAQGVPVEKVVHLALGTSMASIIFISFVSLRKHNHRNAVIWSIVKIISLGVFLGAFLATFVVSQLNSTYLAMFFSLYMAYLSIKMLTGAKKTQEKNNEKLNNKEVIIVGSGIGAISSLVSIGGGSLTVQYLVSKNIAFKKAIGTSSAIGFPISVAGTIGYLVNGWGSTSYENYTFGFVYLPAVICISVASLYSIPIGVKLAHHLPVSVLKKIFAVVLMTLSLKMLFTVMFFS